MTHYNDTFTQGGQTQLHKLHMIRQVVGSTLKIGLGIFAISLFIYIYWNHCWHDFWYLMCVLKAWIRIEYLNILPCGFFDEAWIMDSYGIVHTIKDSSLLHIEQYQQLTESRIQSLLTGIFYSVLISIVGYIAVSWFWVKMGRKKQTSKIISGFECVTPNVLQKRIIKKGASPYKISTVPMPKNAEYQHMMVTGTTGSGKSNMIHQLLEQIKKNGDQAIIVDTTGGIFQRFYDNEHDILLNPLDKRSHHWNMWKESVNDYVTDEIAESIIPEMRSMDSFWIQGARELFVESFRFLKNAQQESYEKLLDMTLKIDLKELQKRVTGTVVSTMLDPSIDKTALSIRASLANHLKIFKHLEDKDDGLSLIDFMKTNTSRWLFLSCPTDQRAFLKPLFSVWLSLIIKGIMTRLENNGSRTWIIIDELASLNRLPSLMTGLAEIRKYGGCFVLGFQDLSQIEEIYGHSTAKTLSNLTGTKVLFRAIDSEVATRVSRYMGEQEKEELSTSISYGAHQMRDGVNLNHQRHIKPVVRASDIMFLNDLEAYVKFPGNLPVSKITFDYHQMPCLNEGYVPKPNLEKSDINREESSIKKTSQKSSTPEETVSNVIHPKFGVKNVMDNAHEKIKHKEKDLTFDF